MASRELAILEDVYIVELVYGRSRVAACRNACKTVLWFSGRESIFSFSHTNEFCGKEKLARELGLA